MKIIPTWFHGILDYVVGVALIVAPWVFGFSSVGGAAVWVPQVLGVGLIIYALLTNYELGLFKLIPMPIHLVLDFIASAFLALSPWIFGFVNNPINVWGPHLIVGIVVIIVVFLSQTHPKMESAPMGTTM